jgi:hypothetical protein
VEVGLAAYNEALKNGTAAILVDGDDDSHGQNALPSRSRGYNFTKANLARQASTLALSKTLEKMVATSQDSMAKQDEKKRLEKEASASIYLNLTKETIEEQRLDAEAKMFDAGAKCRGGH